MKKRLTFTDNNSGFKHITGYGYLDDENGEITFTDNSAYKHITGYGYLDEKDGSITFTDNSAGYKHITGRGYVQESGKDVETRGGASESVGPLISGGLILIFILSVPLSWILLAKGWADYDETFWLLGAAALCAIVSFFFGFMPGIILSGVLNFLIAIFVSHAFQDDFFMNVFLLIFVPVFGAAFGVLPSGLGILIRIIVSAKSSRKKSGDK